MWKNLKNSCISFEKHLILTQRKQVPWIKAIMLIICIFLNKSQTQFSATQYNSDNVSIKFKECLQKRAVLKKKKSWYISITYGNSGSPSTCFCFTPFSINKALWDSRQGRCPIFFGICVFPVPCTPVFPKAGK